MQRPNLFSAALLSLLFAGALPAHSAKAQSLPTKQLPSITPLPAVTITPGQLELIKLESKFADAVEKGGGKAFASWFADDGITLNNGQPAVLGRTAIAATAQWDPKTYHLSWYPEGAQMGPSGDTGFTWGHYDAQSTSQNGSSTAISGRYITFWKKVSGEWKVALDASANEPATALPAPQLPR